eukprot:595406-Hanusia_phi.AAC.1
MPSGCSEAPQRTMPPPDHFFLKNVSTVLYDPAAAAVRPLQVYTEWLLESSPSPRDGPYRVRSDSSARPLKDMAVSLIN